MRCFIREEIRKMQADNRVLAAVALFAVMCNLILCAFYKFDVTNTDVLALYGESGVDLYFFCGINVIVGMLCAMFVGYNILTKEYINDTWDLLMIKVFDGKKIVFAKFAVFMLYQFVYTIFSLVLYVPVAKIILHADIGPAMFGSVAVIALFINIFCYALQYCIQLYIKSFPVAVVLGIFFIYIFGFAREGVRIANYVGAATGSYAFEAGKVFDHTFLLSAAVSNIVLGAVIVYISGKKFYS